MRESLSIFRKQFWRHLVSGHYRMLIRVFGIAYVIIDTLDDVVNYMYKRMGYLRAYEWSTDLAMYVQTLRKIRR